MMEATLGTFTDVFINIILSISCLFWLLLIFREREREREREGERERERERKWPGRPSQCITTGVWRGIADGKITVTLVKAKSLQISSFYDMTDLQIWDKVPSIIKVKIGSGNITQDEEELLLGN